MRVLSLFTGIGGFDLAFERHGFELAGMCELDPHARAVLRYHWPEVPLHDDITTFGALQCGPVDVIVGGFPCQDLSVAGKRAGLQGERSGLFFEFTRIIHEMREATDGRYPKYAVFENVPGLTSSNGGRDFAVVLRELAKLGALDICWRILDSKHFGVPQGRRRIFLVADFGGERAHEILFEPEGVRGDTAPGGEARKSAAAAAQASARARYWDGGQLTDTLDASVAAKQQTMPDKRRHKAALVEKRPVSFNWKASSSQSMNVEPVAPTLRAMQGRDGRCSGGGNVAIAFNPVQEGMALGDQAPPLGASDGGGNQGAVAFAQNHRTVGALAPGAHPGGLTGQDAKSGVYALSGYAVRRLIPLECERLQAFPDHWTRYGTTEQGEHYELSDTQRYKQCGNAVTVSVIEFIASRMAAL